DRHPEERHPQGGVAHRARGPQPHLGLAQGAQPVVARGSDGTAARQDGQDQEQRRLPQCPPENGLATESPRNQPQKHGGHRASLGFGTRRKNSVLSVPLWLSLSAAPWLFSTKRDSRVDA